MSAKAVVNSKGFAVRVYRQFVSPEGGFAITRLVGIGGNFASAARHDDVRDFFERHPAPSAARTVQQTLERIRLNARWLELNKQSGASWVADRSS